MKARGLEKLYHLRICKKVLEDINVFFPKNGNGNEGMEMR